MTPPHRYSVYAVLNSVSFHHMQHAELLEYIKEAVKRGQDPEEIKATLISHGWELATVNEHLAQVIPAPAPLTPEQAKVAVIKETNPAGMLMNAGIVLTAVGVFSLIAASWQDVSEAVILLILAVVTALCFFGGFYSRSKSGPSLTAKALISSGCMLLGATLFLAVRVFDLPVSFPDVCLLWMMGILPVAVKTNNTNLYGFIGLLAAGAALGYPTVGPGSFASVPLLILSVGVCTYVARVFSSRMPLDKKGYL